MIAVFRGLQTVHCGLVDGLAEAHYLIAQDLHLRLNEQVLHPDQFLDVVGPNDYVAPFQIRSATGQHRRHGGVSGGGKGRGQGL